MTKQEQWELLKQGVTAWNKWREENPEEEIDFSREKLSNQNLKGFDL